MRISGQAFALWARVSKSRAFLEEHPYPKVCRRSKCKLGAVQFLEDRDLEGHLEKEARIQDDLKARG